MSGVQCVGCPTGEATIREKRDAGRAFCSLQCQQEFYAKVGNWACSVDENGLATVREAGWTLVYKQTGGFAGVHHTTTIHESGRVERWDGSVAHMPTARAQELYEWVLTTPEAGPTPCCDHFSYHVSLYTARGNPIVTDKKVGPLPGHYEGSVPVDSPMVAPIGYGIFGVVRGPPEDPDNEPLKTRDLFFVYVKEAMNAIKVRGATPLLAAVVAEDLEMMFLPPDANDQGFTDIQRRRVFNRLFDPSSAKGLRTELGVENIREFKQRVLTIAIRRGYHRTARYLIEHKRGKVWEIFTEDEESTREFFRMLRSVPLDRRVPTLTLLLDTLGAIPLQAWHNRYVLKYLGFAVVTTDSMALFEKMLPYFDLSLFSRRLLETAAASSAITIARRILDLARPEYFVLCDALLQSLYVHPYGPVAYEMTTLLVNRLDLSIQGRLGEAAHNCMIRNRPDVFERIIGHVLSVHADIRILMVNAAMDGDHRYIRAYARHARIPRQAMAVLFSVVSVWTNQADIDVGLSQALWADIRLLLERRPVDDVTPIIQQAIDEQSALVVAGLAGEMPYFWTVTRAIEHWDEHVLRMLLQRMPDLYGPMATNARLSLLDAASRTGALRSLLVLRDELKLTDEQIQISAASLGEARFILEVVDLTGADEPSLQRMMGTLVWSAGDEHNVALVQRVKDVLEGLLEMAPERLWEDWTYWKKLYEAFNLHNQAMAFEDRQRRRDTGKSSRTVERRIVL